jgi:hypothetical protein
MVPYIQHFETGGNARKALRLRLVSIAQTHQI